MFIHLTLVYQLVGLLRHFQNDFNRINWKNPARARQLINQGAEIVANNPTAENLRPVVKQIWELLPEGEGVNLPQGLLK